VNLLQLATYGDRRHAQTVVDTPEVKLVLFSLQAGQEVKGKGEPRVHLLALEGEGELWSTATVLPATAGTMLAADVGEAHGARAGDGRFLVLGIITPGP
jgi:quercetin dioxygenase-like cupin family protein